MVAGGRIKNGVSRLHGGTAPLALRRRLRRRIRLPYHAPCVPNSTQRVSQIPDIGPSSPMSNTAISLQRVFCGRVRLRGCLGNRSGERAIGPSIWPHHLHRVQFITEHTLQFRASCMTGGWYHSLTAVQTAGDTIHGDLPNFASLIISRNLGSTS
jgi:hypothetical protein